VSYRIGEVANLSNVSVRTLRHYDDIGLLTPSVRSDAGYRLYSPADVERLKQILFFKTLGFSLQDIGKAMNDPDFDFHQALIEQRERVLKQHNDIQSVLGLINHLLTECDEDTTVTKPTPSFSMFKDFDPSLYEEEAEQNWGDTDAYKESTRRTQQYTDADWRAIKTENDTILTRFADLLKAGTKPSEDAAIAAVEAYRVHIDRWYYPCSKVMHAQLGQMYVSDARFKANFDKVCLGLAEFIAAATTENAR